MFNLHIEHGSVDLRRAERQRDMFGDLVRMAFAGSKKIAAFIEFLLCDV